jgi:hypothetical protein
MGQNIQDISLQFPSVRVVVCGVLCGVMWCVVCGVWCAVVCGVIWTFD